MPSASESVAGLSTQSMTFWKVSASEDLSKKTTITNLITAFLAEIVLEIYQSPHG